MMSYGDKCPTDIFSDKGKNVKLYYKVVDDTS